MDRSSRDTACRTPAQICVTVNGNAVKRSNLKMRTHEQEVLQRAPG